jgi:hypothetical protein
MAEGTSIINDPIIQSTGLEIIIWNIEFREITSETSEI